jgi:hypothetical protein
LEEVSFMKIRVLAFLASAVALLAAPPVHADRLTDLRATLEKLRGDSPVKAQIVVRSVRKNGDEKETEKATQEVTVIAEQGAQGLRLAWSPQMLAEARKAARQKVANPDAPATQGVSLTILDAGQAVDLLDAADALLLDLDRATLVEDKVEPRGGKPTRLLVIKPQDGLSTSDRKSLKSREDVLKIWLDDNGVPVAMDRVAKLKFSKLLISISVSLHRTRTFTVAGDHLVALSSSEESGGSGLGQSEVTHQTAKVTLLP